MDVVFDSRQLLHHPMNHLYGGLMRTPPEQPKRAERLMQAALDCGLFRRTPDDHGVAPLAAVHAPDYLDFLSNAQSAWANGEDRSTEVLPHVHPVRYARGRPASVLGLAGHYMNGTNCPIGPDTFEAAYWSAQAALTAADALRRGERCCYALCRPPGHHAHADLAGGFCYLNNVAIAAQHLVAGAFGPVAVVDLDVHHGNGTQEIFYDRGDVFCASIHADPARCFPFYQGYADETGVGAGIGWNMNLPLPRGSADAHVLAALGTVCSEVARKGCRALVVALGFDGHEDDPLGQFRITHGGFTALADELRRLALPTLLVQEGGYDGDGLGDCLRAFLQPFLGPQSQRAS